jgi:hypothetical protein
MCSGILQCSRYWVLGRKTFLTTPNCAPSPQRVRVTVSAADVLQCSILIIIPFRVIRHSRRDRLCNTSKA